MENRTYKFFKETPLYPFGFGLSYTTFAYENLQFETERLTAGEELRGRVTIRNTGAVSGDELVEIYLTDREASVRVPIQKLVGIQRVSLAPGEEKIISFEIEAAQFQIIREDGSRKYEAGEFQVSVGGSCPDAYSEMLKGQAVLKKTIMLSCREVSA